MALNFVPGVNEITVPISTAAMVTRQALGDDGYEDVRGVGTWAYGASIGFLPTMPLFWPVQIAIFIIVVLVLAFAFRLSAVYSILGAYLGQAVVITVAASWLADKFLRHGVGV